MITDGSSRLLLAAVAALLIAPRAASAEKELHKRTRDGAGLASAKRVPATKRAPAKTRVKKAETRVGRGARVANKARKTIVVASPLDGALERVEQEVLAKHPKATGKVSISFTVGANGRLRNVLVFGFDDALDLALEKQLRRETLPRKYARQRINTTRVFRRGKVSVR